MAGPKSTFTRRRRLVAAALLLLAAIPALLVLLLPSGDGRRQTSPVPPTARDPSPRAAAGVASAPLPADAGSGSRVPIAVPPSSPDPAPQSAGALGVVEGRILDAAPVAGAEVRCWFTDLQAPLRWDAPDLVVHTGADGAFRFTTAVEGDGRPVTVVARAESPVRLTSAALRGWLAPPAGHVTADLRLAPAEELVTEVHDAQGRRLPGVALQLSASGLLYGHEDLLAARAEGSGSSAALQPLPALVQTTDAHGLATWTRGEEPWFAQASLPPRPPWRGRVPPGRSHLLVVLDDPVTLEGRVIDEAGRPVERAQVRFFGRQRPATVETDADGGWEIAGLAPVDDALLVVLGREHEILAWPCDVPARPRVRIDVVVRPGRVLAGQVLDGAGRPATGIEVSLRSDLVVDSPWAPDHDDRALEKLLLPTAVLTSRDGRFRFGGLPEAEYRLRLVDDDTGRVVGTARARSGDEDLLLVTGEGAGDLAHVVGRVSHAAGAPAAGALVSLTRSVDAGGERRWLARRVPVAQDGSFEARDLDPGHWQLSVLHGGDVSVWLREPGVAAWEGSVQALGPGRHEFEVVLPP